jgi:pimeloyl-ACP methyl ester carboxylesterase
MAVPGCCPGKASVRLQAGPVKPRISTPSGPSFDAARHAATAEYEVCLPALMLHGAGGGAWEWTVWQRVFAAAGIATVVPDLTPAAGGLAATRLSDYSDAARRWLEAMAGPRIVIGASIGGLLAWMNADLADVLVLVNPLPASPWSSQLPARDRYPEIVAWGREASLAGTRRSLFDADDAACLFAFRQWRDESGAVMNEAVAGIPAPAPSCPVIVVISAADDDVPAALSQSVATGLSARVIFLRDASHVGPLLGRGAAAAAAQTVGALNDCLTGGAS